MRKSTTGTEYLIYRPDVNQYYSVDTKWIDTSSGATTWSREDAEWIQETFRLMHEDDSSSYLVDIIPIKPYRKKGTARFKK